MKKLIAAIILAAFTLSGCDMAQRYVFSPWMNEMYSENRVDSKHMDAFDGMFTINACGYDLTVPMLESDLPEGFSCGDASGSDEDIHDDFLKYEGIIVCYVFSVDTSSGRVLVGAIIPSYNQLNVHFLNGIDASSFSKNDLDALFGGIKEDERYHHLNYSDGKRLCVFNFKYGEYPDGIAIYCDPVITYKVCV